MKKRVIAMVVILSGMGLSSYAAVKAGYGWEGTDTNVDGKVSLKENLVAGKIRKEAIGKSFNEAAATKFFKAKDKDGDGFLTPAEFKAPVAKGWDK